MPITLSVGSEFNDDEARRVAREAEAYFKQRGVEVKVKARMDEAAARKTVLEAEQYFERQGIDVKVKADLDKSSLRNTDSALSTLIKRLNEVGRATAFTARGLGTLALPVTGIALIDIAKGAVTASQSIALLPAALGAAAAGFGTLQLATLGFSDAMDNMADPKKFAEALQSLSPNAQQAALSIKNLVDGPLKDLKTATQDVGFAGVGEQLQRLTNEYLPELKSMTTSIAGSFNDMFKGVVDQLMTPDTQAAMSNAMTNIAAAFKEITPAIPALTQAFADLTSVGSDFLPNLASGAADAARAFADFIREARESGKLEEFIQNGIDAVAAFGSFLWDLGGIIYQVFGSDGQKNVEEFKDTLQSVNEVIMFLTGDFDQMGAGITEDLHEMTGASAAFRDLWMDIPEALAVVFNWMIDALNGVAELIVDTIARPINEIINIANKVTGSNIAPVDLGVIDIPHVPSGGDWNTFLPPSPPGPEGMTEGDRQRARQGLPPVREPSPFESPKAGLGPYGDQAVPGAPSEEKPFINPSQYTVDMSQLQLGPSAPGAGGSGGPGQPTGPGAYVVDPQDVYAAESNLLSAKNTLEQNRLHLLTLEAEGDASQEELLRARNNVAEQERSFYEAQFKYQDALRGKWEKASDNISSSMDQIGVALDKDLGISRGLAGMAENLVKFIGNLAAAPLLGQLSAISAAQGGIKQTGSGLIGMIASQFGAGGTGGAGTGGLASVLGGGGTGGGLAGALGAAPTAAGGGYLGDAALLANVPAGRYVSEPGVGDLTQGIGDCSSAVEDLVNILDGQPTSGRELSTHNADEWLTEHGFLPGSQAGAFNVGFSPSHMQATLPGGTPFNWGSNASAARGGVGGSGAFDPAFTSHYYRPVGGGSGATSVGGGTGGGSGTNWDAVAGAESSGKWDINTGNGFSGGLQFTPSSWAAAGGTQYAPEAWQATPAQQKAAADRLLALQGPGAWPATSAAHPEWFAGGSTGGAPSGAPRGAQPGLYSPENTDPRLNNPPSMASGGAVPIIAHAGEHMLTGGDVKAMGGQKAVYDFRNALHYDKGGAVPNPFLDQLQSAVTGGKPPPGSGKPGQSPLGALPGPTATPGASGFGGATASGTASGPTLIGGKEPPAPSGAGISGGGVVGAATSAAAMAADMFAPGSGAAVQIASQEIQRAIKFASQAAAIGVGGLAETFLPFGASDLAQNNWLTRIAGGFAGASPQIPNLAGKSSSVDAMQQTSPGVGGSAGLTPPAPVSLGAAAGSGPAPNITVNYTNQGATEDRAGVDIAGHLRRGYESFSARGSR